MANTCNEPIAALRVDGGMSVNELLLQFQSDILRLPLSRLRIAESTALGAAMMAGVGKGVLTLHKVSCENVYTSYLSQIKELYCSDGTWKPTMNETQRQEKVNK